MTNFLGCMTNLIGHYIRDYLLPIMDCFQGVPNFEDTLQHVTLSVATLAPHAVQQVVHSIPNFYRENDNSNNVSFSNAFNIVPALFAVTRPLPSRRVSARGFCLTCKRIRDIGDDGRYFQR